MPDYPFTMDMNLLEQCYLYKQITGEIAHPEFILSLPSNYLIELSMYSQGVQFFEDMGKRPSNLR